MEEEYVQTYSALLEKYLNPSISNEPSHIFYDAGGLNYFIADIDILQFDVITCLKLFQYTYQ